MHLSLSLAVSVKQTDTGPWAAVVVQQGVHTGELQVPWDSFFGVQHTVVMEAPKGEEHTMNTKTKKRRSSKQERKRIEAIGGRAHAGSGAFIGNKSDGSSDKWRMENKFTTALSYRVTLTDLNKLRSECRNGQAPVFNVDFQDKHTSETKDSWVLIPSKEFERLVNAVDNTK